MPNYAPKTDKAALLELCRTIRGECAPKIKTMIDVLVRESTEAERCATRVTAAKTVVSFAISAAQLEHELESGELKPESKGGTTVLVLSAGKLDEAPRAPTPDELSALLAEVSESVRNEQAAKH